MTRSSGRMTAAMRLAVAAMTLLLCSLMPTGWGAGRAAAQSSCFVTLADGQVQGGNLGAACAFLGIPYAASTAGDNRWRPPQPADPWAPSVLTATVPPATCPLIAVAGPPVVSGVEDIRRSEEHTV